MSDFKALDSVNTYNLKNYRYYVRNPYYQGMEFYFEDCYNFLRIEAKGNVPAQMISILKSKGFNCE